jgi:hypothetical protein
LCRRGSAPAPVEPARPQLRQLLPGAMASVRLSPSERTEPRGATTAMQRAGPRTRVRQLERTGLTDALVDLGRGGRRWIQMVLR